VPQQTYVGQTQSQGHVINVAQQSYSQTGPGHLSFNQNILNEHMMGAGLQGSADLGQAAQAYSGRDKMVSLGGTRPDLEDDDEVQDLRDRIDGHEELN